MSSTLEDLAARIARLEARQDAATKSDLVDMRRDIADLAAGIGRDFRVIHADLDGMRGDISAIRHLLERGTFRWPWESR